MNELSFIALVSCVLACGGQTVGDLDGGTDAGGGKDVSASDVELLPDASGGTCSASQPCSGAGEICGYAESSGCNATTGICLSGGPICNTFQPGCACDGTIINIACTGLPSGYTTKPLSHAGTCDGGN